MSRSDAWAYVHLNVRFPGDPDSYVCVVPVYDHMAEALERASALMMNSFARDAAFRAKEKV